MRASNEDLESRIVKAIRNPKAVNLCDTSILMMEMLSRHFGPMDQAYQTVAGFRFAIGSVAFRVTFVYDSRGRLILQYRHREAMEWQNGKFNNRKRNKTKELLARISLILASPPSPMAKWD